MPGNTSQRHRLLMSLLALGWFLSLPAYATIAERIQAANVLVGSDCSGTVIHLAHRFVLTAYHCIEDSIRVEEREERLPDGTYRKVKRERNEDVIVTQVRYEQWRTVGKMSFDAEPLNWDKARDLALLRFRSTTLPFTSAAQLPPPDFTEAPMMPVIVIGNPLGQENTITRGIVSNVNRIMELGAQKYRYIQLDAVIAPGSSGGAVYHADGGFYFAMTAAGYRGVPINFAIPWRVIKEFLEQHCWQEIWGAPESDRPKCLEEKAARYQVPMGVSQPGTPEEGRGEKIQ